MMDRLGLAETTPGLLILVIEFVGDPAAYRAGGSSLGPCGRGHRAVDVLRALFSAILRPWPLGRAPGRRAAPGGRACGDIGGVRGGDRAPCAVVRVARPFRRSGAGRCLSLRPLAARSGQPAPLRTWTCPALCPALVTPPPADGRCSGFAAGLSAGAELLRPLPGLTAPQPLPFAAESPHVGTIGERAWHGADD